MSDLVTTPAPAAEPQPMFHSRETLPPNTGRSMESALAEMKRRAVETAARGTPPASQPAPVFQPPPVSQPVVPYVQAPVPSSQTVAPAPALPPPDAVMPAAMPPPVSQAAGPQAHPEQVVHVEIDGQMVPVTVGELQLGYLREQDYRRKTQQAAQEIRKAQEQQQAFAHARQQLEARLPQFVAQHQQEFAQPIDWERLSREDPIGTGQKVARLLALQQALQEQEHLRQLAANEELGRKQHLMQIGHEVLCRLIPGWVDPPTRQVIQQALAQHAVSMGYAADQVSKAELLDPREIFMAWKSMNYDRLMAMRLQPQPVGARTLEGNGMGRRQGGASPTLEEAQERFRQTGKMEDAVVIARLRREANERGAMPPPPPQPMSRWR